MRIILFRTLTLIVTLALFNISCEEGGSSNTGSLIVDIDIESQSILSKDNSAFQRLASIWAPRPACAIPDLGFDSNCWPYNIFTGSINAKAGLEILVVASDNAFISQGITGTNGRASFTSLPEGFLILVFSDNLGNTYHAPTHVKSGTQSWTKILVFQNSATGKVMISAKTIHDSDMDGLNDDTFSYSLFNRPRNSISGGVIHLHALNETAIDANGDGDFIDSMDRIIIEPDDDGFKSDDGDGDEDNDGLSDIVDPDIDGDGIFNENDPDIDGDGINNADDQYPNGITPNDDYSPPGISNGLVYPGIKEISILESGTVSVFFPVAFEDKNPPVTYIIYFSTTSPVNFENCSKRYFRPVGNSIDGVLSANITGLVAGLSYYFSVRVMDSAQPPNIDNNIRELMAVIE